MKRVMAWLVFAAVLGMVWPTGAPPALGQESQPPPLAPGATPRVGQRVSATGLLTIKYGDPLGKYGDPLGVQGRHSDAVSVRDDLGRLFTVSVAGTTRLSSPLHDLNGSRVMVAGDFGLRTSATGASELVLQAESIGGAQSARGSVRAAVTGTTRWATLLCRFKGAEADDVNAPTKYPTSFFQPFILGPKPSTEDYWKENSGNRVDFAGSTVHDWAVLPMTRAEYLALGSPNIYLDRLATDCAAAAGAGLDFNQYGGVNVMLSGVLDGSAWGGLSGATIGGVNKPAGWPVTWLPEFGYTNQNVVAHEMGHAFRLLHSSGPYDQTYDSKWDVMSDGGACRTRDAKYGCLGDHTNIFHKEFLEWIPADRRFVADGTSRTITLERSALPTDTPGNMWSARIPIASSTTQFYSVEARRLAGYDAELPLEGIIIHRVDTTRADRLAQVVDANTDNNKNVNDASAVWTPGKTFTDAANNITVSVLAQTATGYQITIGPAVAPPPTAPPNVRLQTRQVGPGRLEVTVTAVTAAGATANSLRELRFIGIDNATVDVQGGQAGIAGVLTVPLPTNPTSAIFFVNRVGPGPFLAKLDVADAGGGAWRTFAGGGTNVQ